uniref:non-specific serine/threonine protein kinase n=1 Tax=Polytomella parva TaxID=51329 RepID=A0A7S0YJZ3_9CHLO|mmetsp:Transcript_25134/g.45559  ORF Transcript_25134/g.45559 Transcript_25134/m.45559 type:complete len:264 (+) Transcript_25134:71-862(+)
MSLPTTFLGKPVTIRKCKIKRSLEDSEYPYFSDQGLKGEVKSIHRARRLGLPTPTLLHVDESDGALWQWSDEGPTLEQALCEGVGLKTEADISKTMSQLAELYARAHDGGFVLGVTSASDLQLKSSNGSPVLLSLKCAFNSIIPEDRGRDVFLLRRLLDDAEALACARRMEKKAGADSKGEEEGNKSGEKETKGDEAEVENEKEKEGEKEGEGNTLPPVTGLFEKFLEVYRKKSRQWSATFNKYAEVNQRLTRKEAKAKVTSA